MIAAVVVALAVTVLFAVTAPRLGRRLPPVVATRILVVGTLTVSASTLFVLAVLAFLWVGRHPAVAALGPWSVTALQHTDPIPHALAVGAALLLPVLAVQAVRTVVPRSRALRAALHGCRHLPATGSLVVVDTATADAFTTPHRRGRIVVTTGLLRALAPAERRVVLAHESSHLRHRHPWLVLATDLAATVIPVLGPTARTVAHAVERWADEDAARTVADRGLTARTLARTALLVHRGPSGTALGVLDADVPGRVQALLSAQPRRRPGSAGALIALILTGVVATVAVQQCTERLFEHAFLPAASPVDGAPPRH